MFHRAAYLRFAVVALLGAAAACKKTPPPPPADTAAAVPLSVTVVTLGKQIGADKSVAQPLATFGPADTIYAAVATVGSAPSATLVATWTFQTGQVIRADSQVIAPTGPAITEFHISRPSGWPVGAYKVSVTLNGALAGAKDFEVRR
ncbi:MAG: hypothetical protein ACREMW_09740 [Gemmatimonadales bacterium]